MFEDGATTNGTILSEMGDDNRDKEQRKHGGNRATSSNSDEAISVINKINTATQNFHRALITLAAAVESFALNDTDLEHLSVEEKKSWLLTDEGKKAWDKLAKNYFTQHFLVSCPISW